MSGILTPIQDIITRLELSGSSVKEFVRIWNNQFDQLEERVIESFPFPCAFVEVVMPNTYEQLGGGYTSSDVIFRIHIGQTQYDSQDGRLSENKTVFALRDEIILSLTDPKWYATNCSGFMKISEEQDYRHKTVYHYIVDFTCSFIDDSGKSLRNTITKQPPFTLVVDADLVTEITIQ